MDKTDSSVVEIAIGDQKSVSTDTTDPSAEEKTTRVDIKRPVPPKGNSQYLGARVKEDQRINMGGGIS